LYSCDNSGAITVWKKSDFDIYKQVPSQSSTYLLSLLADNQYLYGGTIWEDCSIKIYDALNLELIETLVGPMGSIFAFASDDHYLFSGSGDSRVIIWNKNDWSEAGFFSGQRHFVLSLAVDKEYIFAGGIDDCTNVFARDDLSQVTSLEGHDSSILSLASDDKYLYSGSGELWWGGPGSPRPPQFESSVRVWDKTDWSCSAVLLGHTANVNAIATDDRFVYSVSDDSTLRIFSKKDWSAILTLEVNTRRIESMTTDEDSIYIGSSDGLIRQFLKSHLET